MGMTAILVMFQVYGCNSYHRIIGPVNIQDVMVILVTCKNEEDLIKNEDARVLTTLNIDFSTTHGQLTPHSKVESGRKSNSCEILSLSPSPARMKKI